MIVSKPPKYIHTNTFSVFLAGSIEMGKAEDWQKKFADQFKKHEITLYNPRRDDWDSSWKQSINNPQFCEQVNWELDHLEKANLIVVYFAGKTQSPITLLELGLWASKAPHKVIVYCPDNFWRKGNVDIVCERYGVRQSKNFNELVQETKKELQNYLKN